MKRTLFLAIYSGLLLSLAIIGGVIIGTEKNILAISIGMLLLVICPMLSMLVVQLSLTTAST